MPKSMLGRERMAAKSSPWRGLSGRKELREGCWVVSDNWRDGSGLTDAPS